MDKMAGILYADTTHRARVDKDANAPFKLHQGITHNT